MKLQYLAIIFIIIIVPISLVLSAYMQTHIDTIVLQSAYDTRLTNATYDAVKAFQLNTANNRYSTVSDSKIRDIEAAIQTFYNTIGTSMNTNGYDLDTLRSYIPAIAFTLYDGYYIYSNHYDTVKGSYEYGLKPFIYYSCRYRSPAGDYDFVVNYTLDNSITIMGTVRNKTTGAVEYVTKTGFLVNPNKVVLNANGTVTYDGILIGPEILSEKLITLNSDNTTTKDTYEYINYNNQRIYKENSPRKATEKYFYYNSFKKNYVNDLTTIAALDANITGGHLQSKSAINYYKEAKEFSTWVNQTLGEVDLSWARTSEGNKLELSVNTGNKKIFNTATNDNNPLKTDSTFNEHRMAVIRKTIETNMVTSIANYNIHSPVNYEFVLPVLQENEWNEIENNICMITFMQGLPIGNKYYNNYSVVSNNTNKEVVGKNAIYILTSDGEYHEPGCKHLIDDNLTILDAAYVNSDFKRQTVKVTGEDINAYTQLNGTTEDKSFAYFYPQSATADYHCIVNASDGYKIDDIIEGKLKLYDSEGKIEAEYNKDITKLRQVYLKALARERYDLYNTNGYLGIK